MQKKIRMKYEHNTRHPSNKKEKNRNYKNSQKTMSKMAIDTIIVLNLNEINSPTKKSG